MYISSESAQMTCNTSSSLKTCPSQLHNSCGRIRSNRGKRPYKRVSRCEVHASKRLACQTTAKESVQKLKSGRDISNGAKTSPHSLPGCGRCCPSGVKTSPNPSPSNGDSLPISQSLSPASLSPRPLSFRLNLSISFSAYLKNHKSDLHRFLLL